MNAVSVMRALLLEHLPVQSIVGDKVYAGDIDYSKLPAVGLREISRKEAETVGGTSRLVTARVQVTVHASTYPEQKALLQAARLGEGVHTGVAAGVQVRSVLRDTVGPDMNPEENLFQQSRDFKVSYLEPM